MGIIGAYMVCILRRGRWIGDTVFVFGEYMVCI